MSHVKVFSTDNQGKKFIPDKFLPKGKDEYHLRNKQNSRPEGYWRHLRSEEIERLVKNSNSCENWDDLLVTERFNSRLIHNSQFYGLVRIGCLEDVVLDFHDFKIPAGITNSRIISCDIGDNVAIHNVNYMAHYIVGDFCILANIDEIHTTNYAKFGNGILKDGEPAEYQVWIDLMNETGCRQILPFDGIIPADAYLWAKYRDDTELQERFRAITEHRFSSQRGFYGTIGDHCVIKHSRIIKDVKIGSHCYIKGANKLKNLTINSNEQEATQIGEGVEMVNGIIGLGCHIFYGSKAVRFIMGNNSNLKYGARLIHSFLGDNSTVSCCEMLNNLIFPSHEQHHNNSFMISTLVMGQSNLAAGATIGSNHNSRANDGEIQAGRGFWPGLCTSVKHSCRFASFILLSKADYPAELNVPLPFCLLNNNESKGCLEVLPAFWWLYDMYALARNTWKFQTRDKRKTKIQNVEFDSLAPDTVEEILAGQRLLEIWTAKAVLRKNKETIHGRDDDELSKLGRDVLQNKREIVNKLEILGENIEKSKRKVVIQKVADGYQAYAEMLHFYGVKNLLQYMQDNSGANFSKMSKALDGDRVSNWVNLGGQLMPDQDFQQLLSHIKSNKLENWEKIHENYAVCWENYPLHKQKHAFQILKLILGKEVLTGEDWQTALDHQLEIQSIIRDRVFSSRKKDFENPFRQATFRNEEEMTAAIGKVEDNSFVKQIKGETEQLKDTVAEIKHRG